MIKKLFETIFEYKIMRFLFVGGTSVIIDISINAAIVFALNIYPPTESIVANIISVSIALIYNFSLSRKWTFKATGGKARSQFIKFFFINIVNMLTQSIIIGIFVYLTKTHFSETQEELLQTGIKILTTAVYAVFNYIIYQKWVFKE